METSSQISWPARKWDLVDHQVAMDHVTWEFCLGAPHIIMILDSYVIHLTLFPWVTLVSLGFYNSNLWWDCSQRGFCIFEPCKIVVHQLRRSVRYAIGRRLIWGLLWKFLCPCLAVQHAQHWATNEDVNSQWKEGTDFIVHSIYPRKMLIHESHQVPSVPDHANY